MKLHLFLPLFMILFSACSTPPKKSPNELRADQLNALLDDFFEAYLRLNPLFATSIGDHRYDSQMEVPFLEENRRKHEQLIESSLSSVRELGCRDLPASSQLLGLRRSNYLTERIENGRRKEQ